MSSPLAPLSVRRIALLTLPVLLLGLAYVYFATAALATRWPWSACRLAPALAVFHGYPLYSPAETGPINGWLYGPVPAMAWMPAALASTPLAALRIAVVISLAFLLVPLFFAARIAGRPSAENALFTLAAFVFGASALLTIYPTWYMASALNGDFAAVGLGLASCLVLLGSGETPGWRRLAVSALLTVLAGWSKQIEAPLALAQLLWLGARHGRASAGRFLLACGAIGLAVSAVFVLTCGPSALLFNMWTIPSHHAFIGGASAWFDETRDFFTYTAIFWFLCAALAWPVTGESLRSHSRAWLAARPWILPLLAALILLPGGALATIKVGGDRNSIHSAYYLIAASALALSHGGARLAGRLPRLAPLAVLLAAAVPLIVAVRLVASYPSRPELPAENLSPAAFAFSREHPGEVYFPWDPLATLQSEQRLYHFEYGIRDRLFAGVSPSAAHVAAGLPPRLRYVIYPRTQVPRVMLDRYLPGFTLIASPGGWLIYHRAHPAASPPDRSPPQP